MKTLTQLQQMIHSLYKGNANYPSEGSNVWTYRLSLINMAIDDWAQNQGIMWRELFTNIKSASDGTKTATTATSYTLPTNFQSIASFVEIETTSGNVYYRWILPQEFLNIQKKDTSEKVFYIAGGTLNIQAPVAGTFDYSYYKKATALTTASTVAEMSKPLFIVYSVVEILYEQDLRNDMVNKYQNLKRQVMDEMIAENEIAPYLNPQNMIDIPYELSGSITGL